MIDITTIIVGIIALLIAIVVYKLWPAFKAAAPAAAVTVVKLVARFVVYAVEADFGSGNGQIKLNAAIERAQAILERYGFTFDPQTIRDAIQEEWLKLNMQQLSTGMKKIE